MEERKDDVRKEPVQAFTFVMTPMPIRPEPVTEKEAATSGVFGGIFWAVILLLIFWFITGGYETLRQ